MGARGAAAARARSLRRLNPEPETGQLLESTDMQSSPQDVGPCPMHVSCGDSLSRAKPHHSPLPQAHTEGKGGKG